MALAYMRNRGIEVRIGRFENCYGPEGTWTGGREKAPAAICRKVALAEDSGTIEVWGNGSALRSYTYVDDLVDGIYLVMQSDNRAPVTISASELITVEKLVATAMQVSGKKVQVSYIDGPVGVQARIFDKSRLHSLGWVAQYTFAEGLARTYAWIDEQVKQAELADAQK
jgi:nucleoside-diphosphate-sugar epimerase